MDFADSGRVVSIAVLKVVAWMGYPAIYFLTDAGYITCKQQHELYLINDVLTKFSYTLIISTVGEASSRPPLASRLVYTK